MLRKFQTSNHSPGKISAFENLVLCLIEIHCPSIDREDFLKIDNLGGLDVDLNRRRSSIDRLRREEFYGGDDHGNQDEDHDHPLSFSDDPPVVPEMNLLLFTQRIQRVSRRRKITRIFI